ncbi:hypothetical protein [Mucilaginibacter sp.]|jgi:hypothetical protein|uniref:hypothetical protein n=1 Tax=Mucilaginibacter sp. TaxID=1882438 RepID=UPI003566B993
MKEQLIARWDAFLDKMRARFNESLTYGEQAVLDALDETTMITMAHTAYCRAHARRCMTIWYKK